MRELGFTVTLEGVGIGLVGEAKRIENSERRKSSRESVDAEGRSLDLGLGHGLGLEGIEGRSAREEGEERDGSELHVVYLACQT